MDSSEPLTLDWDERLDALCLLRPDDDLPLEWFELATGSSIVFVGDRGAPRTRMVTVEGQRMETPWSVLSYRVFHRSGGGQVVELTRTVFGPADTRKAGMYRLYYLELVRKALELRPHD